MLSVDRLAGIRGLWLWSGAAVVLVVSLGGVQLSTGIFSTASADGGTGKASSAPGDNGNAGHPITVTGAVSGVLMPGRPSTLNVTITNPNNQAILITNVTGSITGVTSAGHAGKPPCDKTWYSLGSFNGSVTVAKNSVASVPLPVVLANLANVNQDNCKGSVYSFSFTADGRQA